MPDRLTDAYLEVPRRSALNYHTISNSEVQAYMACQYKHYFAFGLGLTPKNHDDALNHGILGHKVLQAYYEGRRDGMTHKEAALAALDIYHTIQNVPQIVIMQNMKRILEYLDYYSEDEFEVVLVEEPMEVQLSNSTYGFTVDLLAKNAAGKYILFDHKIVPKFWNDEKPKYEPQPFKYVWALRKIGYPVERAYYNFVKFTDSANGQQFRRQNIILNDKKIEGIIREHDKIAGNILAQRKLPISQYKQVAIRNLSHACVYCPFKLPCEMELEGRDISRTLRFDYEQNDYSYQRG